MESKNTDVEEKDEENILYDFTIHAEWPQESEIFARHQKERSNASLLDRLTTVSQRSLYTFMRIVGVPLQTASPCSLPPCLVRLVNCEINWQFALSKDGTYVAILQDQSVEIRSSSNGYDSVVGRGVVPRDSHPQWRHLAWSPDNTMIACSQSNGTVRMFDLIGTLLFTISGNSGEVQEEQDQSLDLSCAVAGLLFTDISPGPPWSAELLVINYHGSLHSYFLDRDRGYTKAHSFLFNHLYPMGVSSVEYQPLSRLLFVGGLGVDRAETEAKENGLTVWRVLSGAPYYKLVTDYGDSLHQMKQSSSYMDKLKVWNRFQRRTTLQDGVYKMCLSPDNKLLVTIHQSGKLCLWNVPSLKLYKSWLEEEQPGFDEISPEFTENPQRRKTLKDLVPCKSILDINWWSNETLIISRCTGAVTVSSSVTLNNLLGKSPEWFEPASRVTGVHDGGFLGLEVASKFPQKRRILDEETEDQFDDSDEEDATWVTKSTRFTKNVMYYVTDSERFQPPRKKPKMVNRTYRLVCLKSTTPEELYTRKIDNEEYGEALQLAKVYGLDSDRVYQRQWRNSTVSIATIQDYLSKINKRSWVLHECLERIPVRIDAMKELLEFGLRGTELQTLITIGKGEDGGRFILCDPEEGLYEDMSFDEFDPETDRIKAEMKKQKQQELLKEVDFSNLNLEQRELCRVRLRLLQYWDRLKTYEYILGGPTAASGRFNDKFFQKFRSQNIVESALDYARQSDWRALETLFTFHGEKLMPHRLGILSNFPETTSVTDYRSLLPEVGGDGEIVAWEEDCWRDRDWCEEEECLSVIDPSPVDLGAVLYEEYPALFKFRGKDVSKETLSEWYEYRSCEIEELSRQVENSVELIKLAMERGVEGLSDLLDDLVTMELLVYECLIEDSISFQDIRRMADYEKLELIMSKTTEEMYTKQLHRWLIPFLNQCERKVSGSYSTLLKDYIVTMSKTCLDKPHRILEASKASVQNPVIKTQNEVMAIALEAAYVCERDDQLSLVFKILHCLPKKAKSDKKETVELHKKVDRLEQHLGAAKILEEHGVKKPLYYVRNSENDADEAKNLMIKLTRTAGHRSKPLTQTEWRKLHQDVLTLQDQVYRSISAGLCHEIFTESLLCSSRKENINLAGELIERTASDVFHSTSGTLSQKVQYDQAVQLVVSSAQEYFNSSTDLTDSCMDLARSCLNLIRDSPDVIQEELDLIASLALLDDFSVSILPLQVRLCKNRLELVEQAVNSRSNSFKQSQKILRLGHLLRVEGDNREMREGKILHLIADAAVKGKDFEFAFEICSDLMDKCYGDSWNVCVDLAWQENFTNIAAKTSLLSFAVTYCTADMIEPILQAKALLETQIIYSSVVMETDTQDGRKDLAAEVQSNAVAALQQTKNILTSTTKSTKAFLSTMTDKSWWEGTISAMKQPAKRQISEGLIRDSNQSFEKQGCHPFYEGAMDPCHTDLDEADYVKCKHVEDPDSQTTLNLLRAVYLEEMLTEGEKTQPTSDMLLKLARSKLTVDSSLGLAYLLALPQAVSAEDCFEAFPCTAISLQLPLYYYALQIYAAVNPSDDADLSVVYLHSPIKVIEKVVGFVKQKEDFDWPEEVKDLVTKLKQYHDLLEDYLQGKTLNKLDRGIDADRFTKDEQYRQETICGLAMGLDDNVYGVALTLADRYNIPPWQIYMAHLEFLFADSQLSTEEIEQRVTRLKILQTLQSQPKEFQEKMHVYIYPTIEGKDHARLVYYYTLLSTGSEVKDTGEVSADTHVKLLKKLKTAAEGLDYKKLMDGNHSPVEVLLPILTTTNVSVIAKLANKIPDRKGDSLHSSAVYCAWAVKLFWDSDSKKNPESSAAWIHRYETCGETLQKLQPTDIIQFIDAIAFVPASREKLGLDCRQEIVKRAHKYCRQQAGGGKKKKAEVSGNMSWDQAAGVLQMYTSHLEMLQNDIIQSLMLSETSSLQQYGVQIDLSKGQQNMIKKILVDLLLDGESIEMIEDLLDAIQIPTWTPRTVVQEAVTCIIGVLSGTNDYVGELTQRMLTDGEALTSLQSVVENIQEHNVHGGCLVTAEDVMVLMRPFSSDSSVAVKPRLDVLHILEKSFELSAEDMILLILYRTEAVVKAAWDDVLIEEKDIRTEAARHSLFEKLLSQADSHDRSVAMCKLLQLWPPLPSSKSSSPADNVWVQVFDVMTALSDPRTRSEIVTNIRDISKTRPLSPQCIQHVYDKLLRVNSPIEAVKCVLIGGDDKLRISTVEELSRHQQVSEDEDLFELLLEKNLVTHIVSTKYYPLVIEYLLSNQNPEGDLPSYMSIDTVVNQLKKAGLEAEAGSLLLRSRSTHPMLQTFGAALGALGKWLKH